MILIRAGSAAPDLAEMRAAVRRIGVREGRRPAPESGFPVLSVVIPVLNAAPALARTLDALASEDWPATEIVVADGGSTDGGLDLIRAREGEISRWLSAPDSGISEGFNRGVAMARGDIVQIVNAGDLPERGRLGHVAAAFEADPRADFVYGDVVMFDRDLGETRRARGAPDLSGRWLDSMAFAPHPSLAARMSLYERVGLFDQRLRLAMDFDWLARCLAAGARGRYDPRLLTRMEEGGASNRHAFARDRESVAIARAYGLAPAWWAYGRLALKMAMNVGRSSAERIGGPGAGYALRRWIDRALLRRR